MLGITDCIDLHPMVHSESLHAWFKCKHLKSGILASKWILPYEFDSLPPHRCIVPQSTQRCPRASKSKKSTLIWQKCQKIRSHALFWNSWGSTKNISDGTTHSWVGIHIESDILIWRWNTSLNLDELNPTVHFIFHRLVTFSNKTGDNYMKY